jgi:hypothetical protein
MSHEYNGYNNPYEEMPDYQYQKQTEDYFGRTW